MAIKWVKEINLINREYEESVNETANLYTTYAYYNKNNYSGTVSLYHEWIPSTNTEQSTYVYHYLVGDTDGNQSNTNNCAALTRYRTAATSRPRSRRFQPVDWSKMDFGRSHAAAWYGLLALGSIWASAADGHAKIIRITSL